MDGVLLCDDALDGLGVARDDPTYEDIASKFFEHFVDIADAMNCLGCNGLWDEADGFYYDQFMVDGRTLPLQIRSMVGIIPLFAVEVLEDETIQRLPGFRKRMEWFLEHRSDLARHITYMQTTATARRHGHRLLAIPSRERLERVLRYLLDENEFLSPYGISALSRVYKDRPYAAPALRPGAAGRVRARRVGLGPVRRQLELARPDLDAGQLPADRGPGTLSPFLWRRPAGRMSHRLRPDAEPEAGGLRNRSPPDRPLPARRLRPASVPWRRPALCGRTRHGATSSCSTNTSTATTAAAWAPAIRRAGPPWSPGCWKTWPRSLPVLRSPPIDAILGFCYRRTEWQVEHQPEESL